MRTVRELENEKATCGWSAARDRARRDAENIGLWTFEQISQMRRLHRLFVEACRNDEDMVRMNTQKTIFSFKIMDRNFKLDPRWWEVIEETLQRYVHEEVVTPQGRIFRVHPRKLV